MKRFVLSVSLLVLMTLFAASAAGEDNSLNVEGEFSYRAFDPADFGIDIRFRRDTERLSLALGLYGSVDTRDPRFLAEHFGLSFGLQHGPLSKELTWTNRLLLPTRHRLPGIDGQFGISTNVVLEELPFGIGLAYWSDYEGPDNQIFIGAYGEVHARTPNRMLEAGITFRGGVYPTAGSVVEGQIIFDLVIFIHPRRL